MILGVGTDIIEISRVESACTKDSFMRKYFTAAELAYFQITNHRSETLAGVFAAKEAVSKALGTGFSGFSPIDIEIFHTAKGAPYVVLGGGALKISLARNITCIAVSISHSREYAVAYAVAEGEKI